MIQETRLNQYRKELNSAAADAKAYIQAVLDVYSSNAAGASIKEIKEYTLQAIQDALSVFGNEASTLANELFEEVAQSASRTVTPKVYETFSEEYAADKLGYLARYIVNNDIGKYKSKVSDLTAFYVKREAFENMVKNCEKNKVRYARVPSGRETCGFCFMLASRGFDYHSKQSAGGLEGHKYHTNCDCVIVPGFDETSQDNQIQGYKPTELRKRYRQCLKAVQTPSGTWDTDAFERDVKAGLFKKNEWAKWKIKRLCAEIEKRDVGWLWRGEEPKTAQ